MIPIWFGAAEHPLAGFLHPPRDRCHGGVIICLPFGYEAACAYRTLRELAERLAENGYLVLRFDYYGTGGSSGSGSEADLLERWQSSVAEAIAEMRRRGVQRPALVGLRLGAGLAYSASARDGHCGPVVLWAPVTSGRRYVRELRALGAVTPGGDAASVAGHLIPNSLRGWDPLCDGAPDSDVLLIQTPGGPDLVAGIEAQVAEIDGTAGMLECSAEEADTPVAILDAICGWLGDRAKDPLELSDIPAVARACVSPAGIAEEFVRVGPTDLHGVITEPADEGARSGVVFLNNGAAPAAGPGRAWAEFARELAKDGITSLRLDFSGLGDSPNHTTPGRRAEPTPRTAGVELLAAVEFLRKRALSDVTVVGLCSGAQVAVRTAAYARQVKIDSVVAINPPLFYLPDIGIGPMIGKLWALTTPIMGRGRIRRLIRLPRAGWVALDRLWLFPSPARYLRRTAERGTYVRLIFSDGDRGLSDIRSRGGREISRLMAGDRLVVDVVAGMDHSMFARAHRTEVLGMLRASCPARTRKPLLT